MLILGRNISSIKCRTRAYQWWQSKCRCSCRVRRFIKVQRRSRSKQTKEMGTSHIRLTSWLIARIWTKTSRWPEAMTLNDSQSYLWNSATSWTRTKWIKTYWPLHSSVSNSPTIHKKIPSQSTSRTTKISTITRIPWNHPLLMASPWSGRGSSTHRLSPKLISTCKSTTTAPLTIRLTAMSPKTMGPIAQAWTTATIAESVSRTVPKQRASTTGA